MEAHQHQVQCNLNHVLSASTTVSVTRLTSIIKMSKLPEKISGHPYLHEKQIHLFVQTSVLQSLHSAYLMQDNFIHLLKKK